METRRRRCPERLEELKPFQFLPVSPFLSPRFTAPPTITHTDENCVKLVLITDLQLEQPLP